MADETATTKKTWTATELRKLPAAERDAIMETSHAQTHSRPCTDLAMMASRRSVPAGPGSVTVRA